MCLLDCFDGFLNIFAVRSFVPLTAIGAAVRSTMMRSHGMARSVERLTVAALFPGLEGSMIAYDVSQYEVHDYIKFDAVAKTCVFLLSTTLYEIGVRHLMHKRYEYFLVWVAGYVCRKISRELYHDARRFRTRKCRSTLKVVREIFTPAKINITPKNAVEKTCIHIVKDPEW